MFSLHDALRFSVVSDGEQWKGLVFGGSVIKFVHGLFDVEASGLAVIADLFGEDRYFADADAFWRAQDAVIEDRRDAYLDDGWGDVVIVPRGQYFSTWEHCKEPKRKGGRIYIEVRDNGEGTFHEGNVTAKEAKRLESGEGIDTGPKVPRPQITGPRHPYNNLPNPNN